MGCQEFLSKVLPSIGEEVELWDLVRAMMDQQGVSGNSSASMRQCSTATLQEEKGDRQDSGAQDNNDLETQQEQVGNEVGESTDDMAYVSATAHLRANTPVQGGEKVNGTSQIPDFSPRKKRGSSNSNNKRKFRIGIDASAWLYKAIHGFGDKLADERHLTNQGRADIYQEQLTRQEDHQQQQPSRGRSINTLPTSSNNAPTTAAAQNQPPPGPSQQQVDNYVQACVSYVLKRVDKLQDLNPKLVQVLIVLDGATPPAKADETERRRLLRQQNAHARDAPVVVDNIARRSRSRNDGASRSASPAGDTRKNAQQRRRQQQQRQHPNVQRTKANRRAGAGPYFWRILYHLVAALRQDNIAYMIAPYEADSQLAYLAQSNLIDLVITEDSDLIALNAKAILYKFDIETKEISAHQQQQQQPMTYTETIKGILVQGMADLGCCWGIDFLDFTPAMLVATFVAAGCDYCPSLKGIGLKTACQLVRRSFLEPRDTTKYPSALDLLFHSLVHGSRSRDSMTSRQVHKYKKQFLAALLLYRHPVVFDPLLRARVVTGCRNLKNVGALDYACPHSIGPVRTSDTGRGGFMLSSTGRDSVDSAVPVYARIRGDPELLDHKAYRKLCNDWPKRQHIAGMFVPSEEAIRLAEGGYYTDKDAWKEEVTRLAQVQQLRNETADNPQTSGDGDRNIVVDTANADTATTQNPAATSEENPETQDAPGIMAAELMQENEQEEQSQPATQPQTNAGGWNILNAGGMQVEASEPETQLQTTLDNANNADGYGPGTQDDPAICGPRATQESDQNESYQFETQLQPTEDRPSTENEYDMSDNIQDRNKRQFEAQSLTNQAKTTPKNCRTVLSSDQSTPTNRDPGPELQLQPETQRDDPLIPPLLPAGENEEGGMKELPWLSGPLQATTTSQETESDSIEFQPCTQLPDCATTSLPSNGSRKDDDTCCTQTQTRPSTTLLMVCASSPNTQSGILQTQPLSQSLDRLPCALEVLEANADRKKVGERKDGHREKKNTAKTAIEVDMEVNEKSTQSSVANSLHGVEGVAASDKLASTPNTVDSCHNDGSTKPVTKRSKAFPPLSLIEIIDLCDSSDSDHGPSNKRKAQPLKKRIRPPKQRSSPQASRHTTAQQTLTKKRSRGRTNSGSVVDERSPAKKKKRVVTSRQKYVGTGARKTPSRSQGSSSGGSTTVWSQSPNLLASLTPEDVIESM